MATESNPTDGKEGLPPVQSRAAVHQTLIALIAPVSLRCGRVPVRRLLSASADVVAESWGFLVSAVASDSGRNQGERSGVGDVASRRDLGLG